MFSFLPTVIYENIYDLTPEVLQELRVKVLLLDYDNTVVPYTCDIPTKEVSDWFRLMRDNDFELCIVSNTKKGRAVRFAEENGIACITRAKKPFQRGIKEAKEKYREFSGQIALVGDQIYTDTLGANCGGLISILIKPIHLHNIWLKLRHIAEKPWIALARRRQNAKS